jgi:serine/threonine protein phosphatase PrpC
MLSPEALIITVADGAGSARYAEVGACLAASRGLGEVCARLAEAEDASSLDDATLKDVMYEGLAAARCAVEAEAAVRRVSAHELSTTLIIVIARPDFIAAAQVGDGATVIADDAGEIICLTRPPAGEHINETIFLTSEEALHTAQTAVWRGRAARLAAFSDGLQLLCLKWPEFLPHKAFFSPLFGFIGDADDGLQAAQELTRFLDSNRIKELTDDDITLVLSSI